MQIKDNKGKMWDCIPAKEAADNGISPAGVVGDVLSSKGREPVGILKRTDESGNEKSLKIYSFREKLSFFEKVAGYIPYEDYDESIPLEERKYVRAVKHSIPKMLLPILLLLLLIAGGIVFYAIWTSGPDIDKAAVAYNMPEGARNTDPTRLSLPFFSEITVDGRQGQAVLPNPDGNMSYFRYVLRLDDNDEVIYRSGLIEPGMAVTDWQTDRRLDPGDYDATLEIQTRSLEDHTQETNGGDMKIVLHVE